MGKIENGKFLINRCTVSVMQDEDILEIFCITLCQWLPVLFCTLKNLLRG